MISGNFKLGHKRAPGRTALAQIGMTCLQIVIFYYTRGPAVELAVTRASDRGAAAAEQAYAKVYERGRSEIFPGARLGLDYH